jgi:hypothetical protein
VSKPTVKELAAAASAPKPVAGLLDKLAPGAWYRVLFAGVGSTDPVKASLLSQGLEVSLITPTSAIGPYQGPAGRVLNLPAPWKISSITKVAAPIAGQVVSPTLDANLDIPTAQAVQIAVAKESATSALNNFSGLLLPEHPAASALLKTASSLLEIAIEHLASPGVTATAGFDLSDIGDFVTKTLPQVAVHLTSDAGDALKAVGKVAAQIPGGQQVMDAANAAAKLPGIKQVLDVASAAAMLNVPLALLKAIGEGKSPEDIVKAAYSQAETDVQTLAPYVETAMALVPAVGPAASSSLALSIALAEGKPIAQATIDAAAASVPGGLLAMQAFKGAATLGVNLVEGKPFDAAALAAARAALPSGPAQAAFDAGYALAHGKNLQDAGFAAARAFLPGDAVHQALDFGQAVCDHGVAGALPALEDALASQLQTLGPAALASVHDAVAKIVSDPSLAGDSAALLASKLGIPEPSARAALASVEVAAKKTATSARQKALSALNQKVGSAVQNLIVVKSGTLDKLAAAPPRKVIPVSALKFTARVGPTAAKAAAPAAAATKPAQGAAIADAARRAELAQVVQHYLSLPRT